MVYFFHITTVFKQWQILVFSEKRWPTRIGRSFPILLANIKQIAHPHPKNSKIPAKGYNNAHYTNITDSLLSTFACNTIPQNQNRPNRQPASNRAAPRSRDKRCIVSYFQVLLSEIIVFIIVTQTFQDFQMIESSSLTPKCFLKSKEMREKYQCGICYEICIKPVKCRGSCARIFCMKCVSDTRQVLDKCPNRCSSPFIVAPIPDIQVDFYCPYNPTLCKLSIVSLKSFNQHHQVCQFVSPEEAYLKKLEKEYKCLKAHQLEFFIGSYEEMIGSTCAQCQEQKLCRSYCRICQQFYCVACRIPPCSKQGCPIGHSFNFQRIANINYICDICGISTAVSNDGVYDDNHCNFGICEACFSQLPEKFDQSKPKSIIANINTQCSCGETLSYANVVHKASVCELCKKNKECPKQCSNCLKSYCIDCKLMDIFSDSTCSQQHPISAFNLVAFPDFMQKENNFGCMKCSKKCNEYYYDRICFTRLCEGCFSYCMKVTTDKERPVLLKCDKNHVLMYICGDEDYYDNCAKCEKQKIVKLACNYCEEDKRTYCFQCKPIPLNTCYYQHKLKFGQFQSERQCHFCIKNFKEFYYCKKCFFFVCKGCQESHLSDLMQPQEACGGVPHHHQQMGEQL